MQPIIISSPVSVPNEINRMHQLFANGVEIMHIRKPSYSEDDYLSLLKKIDHNYHERLVLHQHHSLAKTCQINRLHFPAEQRKKTTNWKQFSEFKLSTSVHSIEEFNALPNCFKYAFLSPVFPSISKKGYTSDKNLLEELKKRTNFATKIVALGGITMENSQIAIDGGFDHVAMLGSVW